MQRVLFIYNPSSGEILIGDLLDEIIALHQSQGYALTAYRLSFANGGQGDELQQLMQHDLHHILIAGGDGTVNYIVNLMMGGGMDVPIAVLPTGTANDFASLLDTPADPLDACRSILTGDMRAIDVGRVNGQYFVNVFSCGLFTEVSQKTPTIYKNTFGRLAYYVSGLGELPKFRRMHLCITSDGGDYEGSSLIFFVFNGRTAGNLRIAYLSEIDDGMLDVLIIRGDNPGETLQTIFHYLSRNRKKYPSGITHIRCSHLKATSTSPETTDIDGQAGPGFPLEIDCLKGALKVLAPTKKTRKRD